MVGDGDLKKHLKQFLPHLIGNNILLECNFAGTSGKLKMPTNFDSFVANCYAQNQAINLVKMKAAIQDIFANAKQLKKKNEQNQVKKEKVEENKDETKDGTKDDE